MKYIVGIDEVGRGPLAGPVTVCVVSCEASLYKRLTRDKKLPPLGKDSKKLSPQSRENYAQVLKKSAITFAIIHISNKIIDTKGLSFAIKKAMGDGIKKLKLSGVDCDVRLDGGLKAPAEFKKQKTIIKGDEKEKIIAWASILAKVSRDGLMTKLHKNFPQYNFHIHKGYGTQKHREAIRTYGLSEIHRKSFCKHIF
ncbi:MAG: ribonuclease HII [bacterium]